jgi:phosphate:Na+ symporter
VGTPFDYLDRSSELNALDALITLFAGLGLFFIGSKLLGTEMAQLTGRGVRRRIGLLTGSYPQGALVGLAGGTLTQSTNAITVILMSLASAGMLTLRQARPILAWANIGTAALVLVAHIDVHLFVLTLMGCIGVCFYLNLDRSRQWRPVVSTLLGLGLLFFGLEVMRDGARALSALPTVSDYLRIATGSPVSAFVAGGALALVMQSSVTVSILSITMASAGLVTLEQAMLLVYGASLGSGFGTYLVAAQTSGTPRQLAIYQALIKSAGVMLLLPLLIVERTLQLPLVAAGVRWLATEPGLQIGLVYLACQTTSVAVAAAFEPVMQPMLERLAPPSPVESLSRPRYLYDQALKEPETALMLVDREQTRIFALLPLHLGIVDALGAEGVGLDATAAAPTATMLIAAVANFLADLADTGANRETLERIADQRARNTLLQGLHETMGELARKLAEPAEAPAIRTLHTNLAEGLGALLLTAEEGVKTGDVEDLRLVQHLTTDRDSLVDTLRRRAMATERGLSGSDQELLYGMTSLFERIVWMLHRFAVAATDQATRRAVAEA